MDGIKLVVAVMGKDIFDLTKARMVPLSPRQQQILMEQSGAEDVTKWAAETLMSALNCLEDIQNGNS